MKFELNTLPRNCSPEEILVEIKRVNSLVNKNILTTQDFNKFAKLKARCISKRFGGWEKALIAAGLGHKYSGIKITEKMKQQSKVLSDEQIMNELRRIASILSQNYVTQKDVNTYSEIISGSTVYYRFGSWSKGVKKAGLEDSPGYNRKYSQDEYFENLLNVWTFHGRQPKYIEMDEIPSKISSSAYEGRFGNWRKALDAFVNKMNQEDKNDSTPIETIQPEQLFDKDLRKNIVTKDIRRNISMSLRYKVLNRDNFKCIRCGRSPATTPGVELEIDHKIPYSKGGKTELKNLETKCKECNIGKGNRFFE